jgi:hypothetical protein
MQFAANDRQRGGGRENYAEKVAGTTARFMPEVHLQTENELMKTSLVIMVLAATALSGCQSGTPTASSGPSEPVSSGPAPKPPTPPPSPDTINNPPSTVAPPAPGTSPGNP